MPYNEELAAIYREALADQDGITEKKMFGGLCFMLNGNMLCGVDKNGGMARVGKEHESMALQLEGIEPLSFTGRKMGGMVDVSPESMQNDGILDAILTMAKDFVGELPAK